jgi:light-regulated signal transduction histidine kinase (bacteriophytochrome)
MKRTWRSLQDEYAATLASHLAQADEAALLHAHELGRKALSDGVGILDFVLLHHHVLARLGASGRLALEPSVLDGAAEFLAESLSPFEMSLRGYSEANANLAAMNERLQQAKAATEWVNRELEAFSYSVAHDLRAPLRSIDGFSQALLEDYADKLDDQGKQDLRYVREATQEMAELIEGLLTLSRVARSELRRELVDLASVARAVFVHLKTSEPGRDVETVVPQELVVEGDPRLLRVVLDNLLGNAWKFSRNQARAKIEIGATGSGGPQTYFVRDNGAGFDMAYAAKLFGVFQRLHSEAEFEGTGIGLATVQRIINRHGGRVWAEGAVDRGSAFYFTLWTSG